jgi:hypothetical protein
MILYWLTLAVVAAVVLALAGYLIAIAWALIQAKRNVAGLADGLEAIAGHTAPLGEKVDAIGGALTTLVEGFGAVDRNLEGAAEAFQR